MRYGFILDQTKCIGCHACTVACKSENGVAVGTFRTWVKYIEKGEFPDTKRFFAVLRCNQCDDAPCIEICPTNALFRRHDGIVDFNNNLCIGCKSCMQGCPYDALYIDPETNTAAKCHFCAHRAEQNLEPACAVVCPTQAIIAGDLDDPTSRISKILSSTPVQVRKPEKDTKPKVFYVGAEQSLLNPDTEMQDHSCMVTEPKTNHIEELDHVRITYQIDHPKPWGTKISAYLWTKSIAAGVMLLAAFFGGNSSIAVKAAPIISLFFLAITGALLVLDLKRPDRFLFILFKPNFKSWLVIGSYIIIVFGVLTTLWLYFGFTNNVSGISLLKIPVIVFAVMTACYSAFLFHQARGRDLWLSHLLFIHLLIAALVAGSASLVLSSIALKIVYAIWLDLLVLSLTLFISFTVLDIATHSTPQIRKVLPHFLNQSFYYVVVFIGFIVPLSLWVVESMLRTGIYIPVVISLCALVSLFEYERLWIKAGQSAPLS